MKIAILDSGVEKTNNMLKNITIFGCALRVIDGHVERTEDFSDTLGHGTAVFYLINKFTDRDYIYNFKIFFDDMCLDMNKLNKILQYIYVNYNFDIINISFGALYSEKLEKLQCICDKFFNKGTFIVAAYDNYGAISYPAACDHVLGVSAENTTNERNIYIQKGTVNIVGAERFYKVPWVNPKYNIVKGNSFLCAEATSFISQQLKKKIEFRETLYDIFDTCSSNNSNDADWLKKVKKAAVFPFNKEIHSLAANEDMLKFEIVDYYHIKHSGIVNTRISKCLSHIANDKIIKNIDNINYDDIDFFIIGHCGEILKLTGIDYQSRVLSECIKRNIKVYSFDKTDFDSSLVYTPTFPKSSVIPRYGKMFMIRQPIVSIVGTSSSQGKFTLQLYFRKKLLEAGYKVGQLGTEPEAKLFGMDITFPIGYNSTIGLNNAEMLLAVNQMLHEISKKDVEIIITGSQAGLLPIDFSNIKHATTRHQVYFQGISPDVIVLCINPYDDITFIEKSIKAAESMSNGRVMGIVCYTMDRDESWRGAYGNKVHVSDEKISNLREMVHSYFKLELYVLDKDEELDMLLKNIIDYLGK